MARRLPGRRVLVVVSHSLQRSEHGEQPVWMGAVLACVLGQIGLPGGGYGYALGAIGYYGRRNNVVPGPTLPQGRNGVSDFIPVAHISDMLLNPGRDTATTARRGTTPTSASFTGQEATRPPPPGFKPLARSVRASGYLVVHELAWTATARHADIVLPCTMTLEREDIGSSSNDPLMVAMHQVAEPFAEARDDCSIFSGLAHRLGTAEAFTEGRTAREWLQHLYARTRTRWPRRTFLHPASKSSGSVAALIAAASRRWRIPPCLWADPAGHPLRTPSGKIEIYSSTIAGFNEPDCPGHPPGSPRGGAACGCTPFLVANQAATRLHSQLDFGGHSAAAKERGREVARMHPDDAAARGIADGHHSPFQRAWSLPCGGASYQGYPPRRCAPSHRGVV